MDNYEKAYIIVKRVEELISTLGKSANLICYGLSPRTTAIGAAFNYNKDCAMSDIKDNIYNAAKSTDPNTRYTFNQVFDMVQKGEL